jgi:CheY-like chemotaxis protein
MRAAAVRVALSTFPEGARWSRVRAHGEPSLSAKNHRAAVCEDNPHARRAICDEVRSLGHEPVPLGTLAEIQAFLAKGELPCYWLQDMEMPHTEGARPLPSVGKTSMRGLQALSNGKYRVPIIVVTAHRNDPDFVFEMARLEADDFVDKAKMEVLTDRILRWLKERGREDHADCAACNARSRPEAEAGRAGSGTGTGEERGAGEPVARVHTHDGVRAVTGEEL